MGFFEDEPGGGLTPLRLFRDGEVDDRAFFVVVVEVVGGGEAGHEGVVGFEGGCEPAAGGEDAAHEPVGAAGFALDAEAADEAAAGPEDAVDLRIGLFLVREGVEAVHGQDDVEGTVVEGERAHVALDQSAVADVLLPEAGPGPVEHVAAVVQADDVRAVDPDIFRRGEDAGADGDVQQLSREVVRDVGQDLPGDFVVIDTAPEQVHVQPAPPGGPGQDVVVDVPGLPVGFLDLVAHGDKGTAIPMQPSCE